MLSLPNSLFKLCDNDLSPNFPTENALVVVFPLVDAVAPVNNSTPLLPCSFKSFFLNAVIARREKMNGARTFALRDASNSSSVTERKGFHTPYPAFHRAARRGAPGHLVLIDANTELKEALSYAGTGNADAYTECVVIIRGSDEYLSTYLSPCTIYLRGSIL